MSNFLEKIERARRGDQEAVGELLEPHLHRLAAFVRLQSGSGLRKRESCADLVQSICRLALEGIDQFDATNEDAFRRWLYSVAQNAIVNKSTFHERARRDVRRDIPDLNISSEAVLKSYADFCTPSQHAMAKEEVERIESAYDKLPPDYRDILSLRFLGGFSHAEIAEKLGRSETAARKLLHRARARLAILAVSPESKKHSE